jgi:hypothetical protein
MEHRYWGNAELEESETDCDTYDLASSSELFFRRLAMAMMYPTYVLLSEATTEFVYPNWEYY